MTKCFWIEPVLPERVVLSMRRFRHSWADGSECPGRLGYHNASIQIGEAAPEWESIDTRHVLSWRSENSTLSHDDPRWPQFCEGCGLRFEENDEWQVNQDLIYVRVETGETRALRDWENEPGAMWDADWCHDWRTGPDGLSLMVVCPGGGVWFIDGPAKNCTNPSDTAHRCWVRVGEPPNITVGKLAPRQTTCGAGAGSIQTHNYHGFLVNGVFTPA